MDIRLVNLKLLELGPILDKIDKGENSYQLDNEKASLSHRKGALEQEVRPS